MSDELEPIENVVTSPPESNPPRPVPPISGGRFVGTEPGDRAVLKFEQIEIPFRWCPPGRFLMGSPETDTSIDWWDFDYSETQVDVTLTKGYWMMETPVTQGLWQAVTGEKLRWSEKFGLGPNHPAYDADWNMANDFATKLTQKLVTSGQLPKDMKLALPTEAQWEYACRSGTTTRFPFGEDPADLINHAWFADNCGSRVIDAQKILEADPNVQNYIKKILENGCKSHPVATKIANPWGLHDMLGNVWEWCADSYAEKLPGGVDPLVSLLPESPVIRGGGWQGDVRECRSAYRFGNHPEGRDEALGFRLAAVL